MKLYNIFIYDNMYLNKFFMLYRYFHNNKSFTESYYQLSKNPYTQHSFSLFVYYNVVLSLCQVLVKDTKISKEVHALADVLISPLKD